MGNNPPSHGRAAWNYVGMVDSGDIVTSNIATTKPAEVDQKYKSLLLNQSRGQRSRSVSPGILGSRLSQNEAKLDVEGKSLYPSLVFCTKVLHECSKDINTAFIRDAGNATILLSAVLPQNGVAVPPKQQSNHYDDLSFSDHPNMMDTPPKQKTIMGQKKENFHEPQSPDFTEPKTKLKTTQIQNSADHIRPLDRQKDFSSAFRLGNGPGFIERLPDSYMEDSRSARQSNPTVKELPFHQLSNQNRNNLMQPDVQTSKAPPSFNEAFDRKKFQSQRNTVESPTTNKYDKPPIRFTVIDRPSKGGEGIDPSTLTKYLETTLNRHEGSDPLGLRSPYDSDVTLPHHAEKTTYVGAISKLRQSHLDGPVFTEDDKRQFKILSKYSSKDRLEPPSNSASSILGMNQSEKSQLPGQKRQSDASYLSGTNPKLGKPNEVMAGGPNYHTGSPVEARKQLKENLLDLMNLPKPVTPVFALSKDAVSTVGSVRNSQLTSKPPQPQSPPPLPISGLPRSTEKDSRSKSPLTSNLNLKDSYVNTVLDKVLKDKPRAGLDGPLSHRTLSQKPPQQSNIKNGLMKESQMKDSLVGFILPPHISSVGYSSNHNPPKRLNIDLERLVQKAHTELKY